MEIKEKIIRFYGKNETYIIPVIKFIFALFTFLMINSSIGYMKVISKTPVALILALVILANLLCLFIVRIAAENCKAVRTAAAGISLFSGSTGSFEGGEVWRGGTRRHSRTHIENGYGCPLVVAIAPYPAGAPACGTVPML